MERIIGKYTLNVTSEEINKDNFFKHSVSVLKPEFIYIDKSELSLWFRYSNDEKGIEDALKGYIRNLKDSGSNPTIYTI